MHSTRPWWLLCLLLAGCASDQPAPVTERPPTPHAAKKPAEAAKSKSKASEAKGKDTRPDSYVVKKGDTLYSIGLEFGYDYREIAKANNIVPPYSLYVGQRLNFKNLKSEGAGTPIAQAPAASNEGGVVVTPLNTTAPVSAQPPVQATPLPPPAPMITGPKATRELYSLQALNAPPPSAVQQSSPTAATPTAAEPAKSAEQPNAAEKLANAPPEAGAAANGTAEWAWPTQGKVIKGFSETGSARGIDIAGTMGQPVLAAGSGKVIYSGDDLRGYGKLVIIKHDSALLSVYAHNSKILVKEGQQVTKGQKIAEMGNSDTDQVKLHFEIRQQGKSVDPMKYLSGSPG